MMWRMLGCGPIVFIKAISERNSVTSSGVAPSFSVLTATVIVSVVAVVAAVVVAAVVDEFPSFGNESLVEGSIIFRTNCPFMTRPNAPCPSGSEVVKFEGSISNMSS